MAELKATPGPWHYTNAAGVYTGTIRNGKLYRGKQVCRAPLAGKTEPSEVAKNWPNNRQLIAAAPDLHAIVERLVNYRASENDGVSLNDNDRFFDDAMAALAKARGESQ